MYIFTLDEANIAIHLGGRIEPLNIIHGRVNKSGIYLSLEEYYECYPKQKEDF